VVGVSGATGASGVSGATGVSGVVGVSGATGVSGVVGVSGATGVSGVVGVSGATGVSGVVGVSGATGVSGVVGVSGATGVSGVAGPAPSGSTGSFVYLSGSGIAAATATNDLVWDSTNKRLGVGKSAPSYAIDVSGSIGASQDIIAFTSDERLKTKTGTLTDALDKVCSLDTFTYIHNNLARSYGFTDTRQYVGLSAQQVQKVQAEVVRMAPFDADGEKSKSGENYITVQYERLVPLLIEAIKEERKACEALEKRLEILENSYLCTDP
jgi:hypothetical protein